MSRLRVLSISTLFPSPQRPGFGKFVEYQLKAVAAGGEVDLVVINPIGLPPWPLSQRKPYSDYARNPDAQQVDGLDVRYPRFRLIPRFSADGNAARIAKAIIPLARQLHAERPFNLVDAQFFFPDGPAAMLVAQALGLPFSIKARGADIHFWGRRPRPLAQIREAGQAAAGLLAVSSALRDDMIALGLPAEKIAVHYTGIDHARFHPLPRKQARALISALPSLHVWVKGPLLVCTGALIARKSQHLVIEALPALPDCHLVLAGEGPDRPKLEALAQRLDVADRVQFLGQVDHDLLPQLLSAADVLVLPSASEGIANAWIEALACGTPLVIPDIGGAREVIRDDSAGRIVARTPAAIAAGIESILAAPPCEDAVAANAAPFSWQRNAAELVAYWQGLVRS